MKIKEAVGGSLGSATYEHRYIPDIAAMGYNNLRNRVSGYHLGHIYMEQQERPTVVVADLNSQMLFVSTTTKVEKEIRYKTQLKVDYS